MPERRTEIDGWQGDFSLQQLGSEIHQLTFERLRLYYAAAERELQRQAGEAERTGDENAALLESSAYLAHRLRKNYEAMK